MSVYLYLIFNIIVISGASLERYQVTRTKVNNDEFSESIDTFTNKDSDYKQTFCTQLNATCSTQSCKTCKCKRGNVWLSYQQGCVGLSYLGNSHGIDGK